MEAKNLGRPDSRIERDVMGELKVPGTALYGAQTARALQNFTISGLRMPREMIRAVGLIKAAAAQVNRDLGLLDEDRATVIVRAAMEVADGKLDEHFPVDVFQSGSGTSTNMNANEVIARRAGEIAAAPGGSPSIHPNDHVNKGQSSNDVIPAAIHVASLDAVERLLVPQLELLVKTLEEKAVEFDEVVKVGRTHLQDAMPIRLGQEFGGYAHLIAATAEDLRRASLSLCKLHLGGTAVGTGTGTHPEFGARMAAELSAMTGLPFSETSNHFAGQSYPQAIAATSASLRSVASVLLKVANDVRWLGSGPRSGLGELILPVVQPGSSIMPGKVNPVLAEALMMVCVQVIGLDAAVNTGAFLGNFELNTMLPLLAHNLLQEITLLANGIAAFRTRLLEGVSVDRARVEASVEQSLALATPLAPLIGYDAATRIAQRAHAEGRTIRDVARELGIFSPETLARLLDVHTLTEPGLPATELPASPASAGPMRQAL